MGSFFLARTDVGCRLESKITLAPLEDLDPLHQPRRRKKRDMTPIPPHVAARGYPQTRNQAKRLSLTHPPPSICAYSSRKPCLRLKLAHIEALVFISLVAMETHTAYTAIRRHGVPVREREGVVCVSCFTRFMFKPCIFLSEGDDDDTIGLSIRYHY